MYRFLGLWLRVESLLGLLQKRSDVLIFAELQMPKI